MLVSHAPLTPELLIAQADRTCRKWRVCVKKGIPSNYPRVVMVSLFLPCHWIQPQITIPAEEHHLSTAIITTIFTGAVWLDSGHSQHIHHNRCSSTGRQSGKGNVSWHSIDGDVEEEVAGNKLTWNRWHIIRIPASTPTMYNIISFYSFDRNQFRPLQGA